jgi:hypothetical protein
MATNTYVALDTKTVGTAVSSVTFTSIPQGYTDLVIVISGTQSADNTMGFQFNGDTASNYSTTRIGGDGSGAASTRWSNTTSGYSFLQFTTQNTSILNIMNYSNATTYKTVLSRSNNASNYIAAWVSLWRKTPEAINSIKLLSYDGTTNFAAGSTFTIYGIANADNFNKANGGVIVEDSTNIYHIFGATGAFIPKQALTANILAVAGGGGGWAGAGGAGGHVQSLSQSLANGTSYTVTVGAGGVKQSTSGQGGNSNVTGGSLSLTAAVGGGYGGGGSGMAGGNGGSGGGGGWGYGSGGSGTSGQGYAGGTGSGPGGGAGGGAGGAASNPNGGIGTSTYSSLLAVVNLGELSSGTRYICGGGGWPNGLGGGGYSASGLPNTGGGGGGDNQGGSGFVIIWYPK